ncbi:L10-interacting MYB domain-containing protein [Camellia lanceoleosa]|uniref:L10-interacting MYB domain-containing protein n=1 Tax=Camellia lanceoleosa TaxID=1840588 RepID=A0ACC0GCH9_9ERIC|nr:L10-interacting MYB domain-containing protein [Camellia lanceoleosa]
MYFTFLRQRCVAWVGWCDEFRSERFATDYPPNVVDTSYINRTTTNPQMRQFDNDNTKLFLQLIIAEMDAGNRQPCGLSMSGYKNVVNKFLDKIGLLHSSKQMKNKYANLKKDWVAWKKLENASQGLTGLGYDQETGLFTAPDHWWAKMQAICRAPTKLHDDDATTTIANEDSGMVPLSVGTPPCPGHDTVGENVVDSSFFDDASLQSAANGLTNAKCRKRPTPGTVASIMDNLVEAVNKQSRELKITQYVVTGKGENTFGDCLARLMSMPGLELGGKLFLFSCGIIDSPDNHDIIMSLPRDYIVN